MRNRLDDRQRGRLSKLYVEQGLTIRIIAERFGVTETTIGNELDRQGIKRHGHREYVTASDYASSGGRRMSKRLST